MRYVNKVLLLLLISFFIVRSYGLFLEKTLPLINTKPVSGNYRSDELVFLRTFYLMKEGVNYYAAFNDSVTNDSRGGYLTKDVFAWRLPTVFYYWTFFARDGFGIGILYIMLSSISLICVYKIVKLFLNSTLAILSPIMLAPYYLDAYYYQTSLLFTEWWGLFFFIFGLTAFFYNKKLLTIILFSISILSRELFLVPILFMLVVSTIFKRDRKIFLIILIIFLFFYVIHYNIVQSQSVNNISRNPLTRLHFFSFPQFQREIAFSMRQYPFLGLRLPLVLVILSIATFVAKLITGMKNKMLLKNYCYLYCSFLPILFIIPFTGILYNDYWGISFMPLLLAFIPILL